MTNFETCKNEKEIVEALRKDAREHGTPEQFVDTYALFALATKLAIRNAGGMFEYFTQDEAA